MGRVQEKLMLAQGLNDAQFEAFFGEVLALSERYEHNAEFAE